MTDYAAFIPVVNRFDLLDQAVNNAHEVWPDLSVIDNSPLGIPDFTKVERYRGLVPFTFSQSMNLEFEITIRKNKKFLLHMHSDSIVPKGAIGNLLNAARLVEAEGRKWGVIYTHYDIMAVYNPEAYKDIGGYDTVFPDYFSDNDWYHRLDLAGYERIDTGIEVGHLGSQTINSDPNLMALNAITFPLMREYYIAKWGGAPGHEAFQTPFAFDPYVQLL